jgi:hypothetical protein
MMDGKIIKSLHHPLSNERAHREDQDRGAQ